MDVFIDVDEKVRKAVLRGDAEDSRKLIKELIGSPLPLVGKIVSEPFNTRNKEG